ncbi:MULTISPECIES: hypothetical protein [Pseudomonas]|uniref:Uncharacterized protein n=1 Tax=Pseudomonas monteilii TaxID=76759 RepID=A0A6G6UIL0_9PSED|nr:MULTISPECIES: hypothetical protein [Pseudomonas]MBA6139792.1 hypothetical protein [Pseudomonas monteilii]MBZ3666240.1 hypothetical protein [Pseudomonas monteilii]MBZ3671584.1 hypothetical protein [Pseudomonas monteilii]MCA4077094.1 hypothetical protein [Pseudomonas kurunegalensis]MCE0909159.1 hypothetical protein [Pseudomonas kurunegalensis]
MTAIHDQAMHYVYEQVLERLLSHMSQSQRASLQLLIQRLLVAAGGLEYIGTFRLQVLQGGDRNSARLLAMLRAAQLSIALRAPVTFQLRVLVVSLPVADSARLDAHERSFSALFMQDDLRVQLQMIEGGAVVPFRRQPSARPERWALAKDALLMFGHLVDARPEALLGSRLHLELAGAIGFALQAQAPADALVTAIPGAQRRRYLAWARRSLRLSGERGPYAMHQCLAVLAQGLGRLHGLVGGAPTSQPALGDATEREMVRLIALDDLLPYVVEAQPLDSMLAFSIENAPNAWPLSAFVDPQAAVQLHELRARSLDPQSSRPALRLAGQSGGSKQHEMHQSQLGKIYGINQTQLVCLLFSPFARQGKNLERFLQCRHADMLVALPYLHRALQGKPCPDAVKAWLVNTSGLPLVQLRAIYSGQLPLTAWRLLNNLARRDVHLRLMPRQASGLRRGFVGLS